MERKFASFRWLGKRYEDITERKYADMLQMKTHLCRTSNFENNGVWFGAVSLRPIILIGKFKWMTYKIKKVNWIYFSLWQNEYYLLSTEYDFVI